MSGSLTSAGQDASSSAFDPMNVNLDTSDPRAVICYIEASTNEYNGHLGARVSALFVRLPATNRV